MAWYHSILLAGAAVAALLAWNVPRSTLWLFCGVASFVASSLWHDYGFPYASAFGAATNFAIIAAIYFMAKQRWEMRVWNCFHLMILFDVIYVLNGTSIFTVASLFTVIGFIVAFFLFEIGFATMVGCIVAAASFGLLFQEGSTKVEMSHYQFAVALELMNWLAILTIAATGISERVSRGDFAGRPDVPWARYLRAVLLAPRA